MDFFGPHIFGYLIALIHTLGLIAALHAVLTVRTAQGSIAWKIASKVAVPFTSSCTSLFARHGMRPSFGIARSEA